MSSHTALMELEGPGQARVSAVHALPVRILVFSVLTLLATWVGRATYDPQANLSLIWPVSGIGIMWLTSGNRRTWPVDVVALTLSTGAAVALTAPGTLQQVVMGTVLAVLQPVVYVVLIRRLAPSLWGSGGTRPFSRVTDVAAFLAACAVAAALTSALRYTGLGLQPRGEPLDLLVIWARNLSWMVGIGTLVLQVAPVLSTATHPAEWWERARRAFLPRTTSDAFEAALIVVVTTLLYAVVFSRFGQAPLMFLFTLAGVWAAVRLTPASASLHALASGTAAVLLTLSGRGAFATLSEPKESAMFAQLFVLVSSVTAVIMAFRTAERDEAMARALASERLAADRAGLLDAVVANLTEGIIVIDDHGEVVLRNPASVSVLDLPPGLGYDEALPGPRHGIFDGNGRRLTASEVPHTLALRGIGIAGKDLLVRTPGMPEGRLLEFTAAPLSGRSPGDPVRAVVNFRDVTKDREDRAALASFAGVVAHDLNNPLTIVSGWADVMSDAFAAGGITNRDGAAMVARIQGAAGHMRRFIDDLLHYTVARDHPLRFVDLDLSAVFEGAASLRREHDSRPQIHVEDGIRAYADAALTRQLADNLIGNAVKYVGPGVRPRIEVSSETRDGWVTVSICDNGIGIPEPLREKVFEDFQRAHPGDYAGTGIGLAICRRVVQRHGGTIRVEDNPPGPGSRFVLTLPAVPTEPPPGPPITETEEQEEEEGDPGRDLAVVER